MKEEFLHFIWKNKLFQSDSLWTNDGEPILILNPGRHNTNAGPDFFDARIRIGETLWAGNIEIHQRASDWNRHGHQSDPVYRNTILHVVAISDIQVFNDLGSAVPALVIKWPEWIAHNYELLIKSHDWIGCASLLYQVDPFRIRFFLNGVVIERLKQKIDLITKLLEESGMRNRIIQHIGDAEVVVPTLKEIFDLVFIDADKRKYLAHYNLVFPKVALGGVIIADNTLWAGKVIQKVARTDEQTIAILQFNDFVKSDPRVETFMIPVRDGITVLRKISE